MGNKSTKLIICIVLGFVLIVAGVGISVAVTVNQDHEQLKKLENDIQNKYKLFKAEADLFPDARKSYQTTVVENLYIESVSEEYEGWIESLESYRKVVDNVVSKAEPLKDLCIGKEYTDQTTKNDCDAYTINYETIMNYFVKDAEAFNEFMSSYYKDYGGDSETYPLYSLDGKKYQYIDINDDGKFIGKD